MNDIRKVKWGGRSLHRVKNQAIEKTNRCFFFITLFAVFTHILIFLFYRFKIFVYSNDSLRGTVIFPQSD